MPLYEYKCDSCGQIFEVRQNFADEPLKTHEGCGGAVERLLSAPALQFKGSGWYITDYAKSGSSTQKKNGGTEAPAAPKTESSSTTASSTDKK